MSESGTDLLLASYETKTRTEDYDAMANGQLGCHLHMATSRTRTQAEKKTERLGGLYPNVSGFFTTLRCK